MRHWQGLTAALLLSLAPHAWAEPVRGGEPMDWLIRMEQSAQTLNYNGVYTFSHEGKAETSRITHSNDGGSEHSRIESLDGPPREVIRENNLIVYYLPDSHLVKIERVEGRHFFPSLLSGSPMALRELYTVSYAGIDRVAGRDCQLIRLEPKDAMRFGYRLCADNQTGLMLRATLDDGSRGILQQFTFTAVDVDGTIDPVRLRPSWSGAGWLWDRSALAQGLDVNWSVANPPSGFRKVLELRRPADAHWPMLTQLVFSDGIAAISLFVEPAHGGASGSSESRQGALSFYSSRVGDQQVTAIGEVPAAAVAQMVKSAIQVKTKP